MLLEKDFRKIFQDQFPKLPMMVPDLYNVQKSDAAFEKSSAVGQVPDFAEFTGKVVEVSPTQAYDKTCTFTEYAAKIEIQRKLAADDQYRVMSRYPRNLSVSASRSREKLGAQTWDLAFTFEPTDGDGSELCASDHGSNVPTTAAQSNEGTLSLSATNVETVRLAMHTFKDDIGELLSAAPDTITIPRALEQTGWEIINTKGKVDTADNNSNFHKGKYKLVVWDRLTDTNNWFNEIDPRYNQSGIQGHEEDYAGFFDGIVANRMNCGKPRTGNPQPSVQSTKVQRLLESGDTLNNQISVRPERDEIVQVR